MAGSLDMRKFLWQSDEPLSSTPQVPGGGRVGAHPRRVFGAGAPNQARTPRSATDLGLAAAKASVISKRGDRPGGNIPTGPFPGNGSRIGSNGSGVRPTRSGHQCG